MNEILDQLKMILGKIDAGLADNDWGYIKSAENDLDVLIERIAIETPATTCIICGSPDPNIHATEPHRLSGTPR